MKKLWTAVAAILSLAVLGGCSREEEFSTQTRYFFNMNTQAELVITDVFTEEKNKRFNELCVEITDELSAIEKALSVNVTNSGISKFNSANAGEKVEVGYTAYSALTLAKSAYELTGGCYNPAVYYSVHAYGFNEASDLKVPPEDRIPSDEKIEAFRQISSHFGEVQLVCENNMYYAVKPAAVVEELTLKVDLGGLGKGIAVDRVNELLTEYGFEYGYFSFGTSSIACKKHYKNGEYNLGLTNPRSDEYGKIYANTSVRDECLSTSGDYQQFFLLDGAWYCHVIDPATARPVNRGIMSATVIGGTAAEGDALTTAIMAMDKDYAVKFINEKLADRRVVFSYDNGGKYEIYSNFTGLVSAHKLFTVVQDVA